MNDRATQATGAIAVVVPVKSFELAKGRLADAMRDDDRALLARSMATSVVAAAGELPAWVVCDDAEVASWAEEQGAKVIHQETPGLNPAVIEAVGFLTEEGFDYVLIAHGDLPLASSLAWVADWPGVTIIPDRACEGTNVLVVPTGTPFEFGYGRGSFGHHLAQAELLNIPVRVVRDDRLGWDVDSPEDLAVFEHLIDDDRGPSRSGR